MTISQPKSKRAYVPPNPLPSISRLPVEIVGEVLCHLDCHTVRSVVRAIPEIRQYCVVITGRYSSVPVFFREEDLRCSRVQNYLLHQDERTNALIKLIEVDPSDQHFSEFLFSETPSALHQYIDKMTFTHIQGLFSASPWLNLQSSHVLAERLGLNGSKVLLSDNIRESYRHCQRVFSELNLPNHTVEPEVYPPDELDLIVSTLSHIIPSIPAHELALRKLELDVTSGDLHGVVNNTLEELTINFYDRESVPIFYSCRFKNVSDVKIFFTKSMPVMWNLEIGAYDQRRRKYFEITHVPSAQYVSCGQGFYENNETELGAYSKMTKYYEFLYCFTDMRLSDVPAFFASKAVDIGGKCLRRLQLFITASYPLLDVAGYDVDMNSDSLDSVLIFVSVPGTVLPYLQAPTVRFLSVCTVANYLSLNSIVNCSYDYEKQCSNLWCLNITCRLPKDEVGGPGHVLISANTLYHMEVCNLLSFSIRGCVFGWENELLGDPGSWLFYYVEQENLCRVHLELVRLDSETIDEENEHKDRLDPPISVQRMRNHSHCTSHRQRQRGSGSR